MPNILVVDDSATQIAMISSVLQQQGLTVRTAANGREALASLREDTPDLVITDMQMPEMNGVELIRAMRTDFSLVPAVLVTAFGNEDLAAEALGVGAANYISKDHVGILLPDIVARMTSFAQANAQSLYLKGALTRSSFEFVLDCSIERITPLVSLIIRLLASMNVLHTSQRIRMAEALDYLIFHSIIHGNFEVPVRSTPMSIDDARALVTEKLGDPSLRTITERIVTIQLDVTSQEARFTVAHEGPGQPILHAPMPGTPQSFSDERGRGMLLMTSVMDEVFVDAHSSKVTLVKYISR
ncbi:Alkaline phosphatase synthesis transcriptional regulatory protein SphR [Stieleria maiorica]|uniref:Alkaline phosphatase synthesis transcriptional regulatory protein SphR n=1 Tax=Stieleria maiorica TaxID=2795974 RepID=A0A5B9MDX5_9BACT|nr:response regulator [Stieleria maiorica]QEF99462.1 Alkaline phosphatase synthesis transcriptional regulatory protein SphR [Stieleria maiorica]